MEGKALEDIILMRDARGWEREVGGIISTLVFALEVVPGDAVVDALRCSVELQQFFIELQKEGK